MRNLPLLRARRIGIFQAMHKPAGAGCSLARGDRQMTRRLPMLAAAVLASAFWVGALLIGLGHPPAVAAEPRGVLPAPIVDEALAKTSGSETAILSGGCFWGMQLVFQHVRGVREVISGYTGGERGTAHYEDVSSGSTGHAESVEIVFDPHVVSYGMLLRVYFAAATDPTELDYQGPDQGSQYRGVIWATNGAQARIAKSYVEQLEAARLFPAPIVTRIESARPFYRAEGYHQNFATLHPYNAYIMTYDAPKVIALAHRLPQLYVARPTRVLAASARAAAEQGVPR
jgi:peptide-methionine (S)-S-oxide reductase